jgi:hypothetical protein
MGPALVVMAAGLASRFGRPKQLVPVGPAGEALMDYTILDALRAGFGRVVMITRPELEGDLRAHLAGVLGTAVPVAWAMQRLDDLPPGFSAPAERVKPWGTAHALLAARHTVTAPFAVCNADDYYGPGGFHLLAEHLGRARTHPPTHALTGYRLNRTLSPHGGVARAVATADSHGELEQLVEVLDLRADSGTGAISGRSVGGKPLTFRGDELVSMNLWGFDLAIFAALEAQLAAFLSADRQPMDAELRLSEAVGEQVASGQARVRLLAAPDRWFGMTYADDLPTAREAIGAEIRAGVYPGDLRETFRTEGRRDGGTEN